MRNAWIRVGFASLVFVCCVANAYAQMGFGGGMGQRGPEVNAKMAKLFGENKAFTATMEVQTKGASPEESMTMPGVISFDDGKSRFEINLLQGGNMGEGAAAHMKAMGMEKMIMVSRPDKKLSYMVYPGLQAYVETPLKDNATATADDLKIETTELGKETVDGHPTIKTKAVITDKEGNKFESIVWNATDLKKFPIKIEQKQENGTSIILFKDIMFSKPAAEQFDPPAGLKKYDSMQAMMQQEMLKRMNRQGLPPGHP